MLGTQPVLAGGADVNEVAHSSQPGGDVEAPGAGAMAFQRLRCDFWSRR